MHSFFSASSAYVGVAAFVASAINSAAGGGSFLSFPALLATGMAPITANATNNTAMWLGSLASAGAYRAELDVPRRTLVLMIGLSLIGSTAGALVLLHTSNETFARLIPYLLLGATLLFVFGPRMRSEAQAATLRLDHAPGLIAQLLIAVYGGYFGAAIGILMLAMFSAFGVTDMRKANALKTLLATCINGIAVIPFVLAHVIAWDAVFAMSIGAILGGYLGARIVRRLPSHLIRRGVATIAWAMTAYFFWKTYAPRI